MNKTLLGVSLTIVSTFIYAVQMALVKGLGGHISVPVVVFFQSIVCFLLILPLIFKQGYQPALNSLKTKNLNKHILRTIFSLGISYFLFSAVKFIPLVDAALLVNTAPLMMPFLGLIFLSQKINHRLWLPLIIGFIGVVLVLHPNGEVFQTASLLALAAGVCMAASIMLVRQTSQTDSALTNAFYYFLISLPISAVAAFLFWTPVSLSQMLILAGIGVLFFFVQISLMYAAKYVTAQTVGSFYLLNIVFSAVLGWFIWHTMMTGLMLLGIVLTLIGAVLTIQAQSSKKIQTLRVAPEHE